MCQSHKLHGTFLGGRGEGHRFPGDERDIRQALTSFTTEPEVPLSMQGRGGDPGREEGSGFSDMDEV